MKKTDILKLIAAGAVFLLLAGCAGTAGNSESTGAAGNSESTGAAGNSESTGAADPGEVIVYTAVDQVHSEKIFEQFEKASGIRVRPVYDLEANKTTGLTNKILAEMDHPVCDVFWNNEFAQTIVLQRQGHSP